MFVLEVQMAHFQFMNSSGTILLLTVLSKEI